MGGKKRSTWKTTAYWMSCVGLDLFRQDLLDKGMVLKKIAFGRFKKSRYKSAYIRDVHDMKKVDKHVSDIGINNSKNIRRIVSAYLLRTLRLELRIFKKNLNLGKAVYKYLYVLMKSR